MAGVQRSGAGRIERQTKTRNTMRSRIDEENLGHYRQRPHMRPFFITSLILLCCTVAFGQASEYNGIYKDTGSKIFSRKPNAFLGEVTRTRKPGKALDVGMGQGRNSIYLARHGWDVTGFDASDEGVRIARAQAARVGIKLSTRVATFDEFDFGENAWDLIVLMYVPARDIAPKVLRALKPGGAVVVEDRHRDTRRVWPEGGLFTDNELPTLFPGLRVLRYEDFWGVGWVAGGVSKGFFPFFFRVAGGFYAGGGFGRGGAGKGGGGVCWGGGAKIFLGGWGGVFSFTKVLFKYFFFPPLFPPRWGARRGGGGGGDDISLPPRSSWGGADNPFPFFFRVFFFFFSFLLFFLLFPFFSV